jgi:hypothetical protein
LTVTPEEIWSQNWRMRSTRCSGALPAIELDAALVKPLVDAGLVGAERAASLQHEN